MLDEAVDLHLCLHFNLTDLRPDNLDVVFNILDGLVTVRHGLAQDSAV